MSTDRDHLALRCKQHAMEAMVQINNEAPTRGDYATSPAPPWDTVSVSLGLWRDMARIPAADSTEEFMRSPRLGHRLAIAATYGVALLIVGLIGFGTAIWQGAAVPPRLDVRLYTIHIVASRTGYPHCPPTTLCPPESTAPAQAYFVIWSIQEQTTVHWPYGRTAKRLLVVPLKR